MSESPVPATPVPGLKPAYRSLLDARRAELRAQLAPALGGRTRVTLEIGCGHGHFLTAYANAHPEALCLGIDLAGDRVDRAVRKRDRAQLRNLHFFQAEARLFVATLPPEVSLEDIYILFPDPWPKLRHNKHRIIQADFLASLATRTMPGGRLCFRTDHAAYFDAGHATLRAHPDWEIVAEPWPFEFTTVFQSRAPEFHSVIARRRAESLRAISDAPEKNAPAN